MRLQSLPPHPSAHVQVPLTHAPCPEHDAGHQGSEHALPAQPEAHAHAPSWQTPCTHVGVHSRSPHVSPVQPPKQKHWPDLQAPWRLHSSVQPLEGASGVHQGSREETERTAVGASTSRANGCNEWRAVVEDVRRRMRRLIQSARDAKRSVVESVFCGCSLKAHAKEKGGGRGYGGILWEGAG